MLADRQWPSTTIVVIEADDASLETFLADTLAVVTDREWEIALDVATGISIDGKRATHPLVAVLAFAAGEAETSIGTGVKPALGAVSKIVAT
jgi:hypothetical protein